LNDIVNNSLNDKNIIITGGFGYIGSALVDYLQHYKCNIVCVSRRDMSEKQMVRNWTLDLTKESSWKKIVDYADIIFHLAGNTSIPVADQDPKLNLIDSLAPIINLVHAAKDGKKTPRVVFASTVTLYGLTEILPVSEEAKPSPITTYDLHKLFIEQYLEMATKNKIISATSLRLSNVYGPSLGRSSANDRGVLNKVTELAINGKDITIYGEGNYIRDYIYIDDVVSAFIHTAIADHAVGKVLNVTSGVGHTIKDAFSLVSDYTAKLTGKKVKINHIEWPKGISMIERRNFIGNASELKRTTKWQPNVSFEEGVDIIVEEFWKREGN
jgi:nucleoside-diphosphate-sugar epimerase